MTTRTILIALALTLPLGGCVSILTSGYIAESDANGDGSLSFQEYFNSQKPKDGFKERVKKSRMSAEQFATKEFRDIDTNHNNLINEQELLKSFGY